MRMMEMPAPCSLRKTVPAMSTALLPTLLLMMIMPCTYATACILTSGYPATTQWQQEMVIAVATPLPFIRQHPAHPLPPSFSALP